MFRIPIPGQIGVYAGSSVWSYFLTRLCTAPGFIEKFTSGYQVSNYFEMMGNSLDFLSTRVSYKLNLRGPSFTMLSACSTSLLAVTQACQSLLTYQSDMALAGGVSITFPQKRGYYYQDGGMVSPDGHCRAFDADAQGTVFGSGVGVVLLKRLDEAIRDGDQIYAVIRGFAVNNDGSAKVGYTAPSVEGQASVIAMAHEAAGVEPESIGYIEAHGTGTPLGDPIELAGLTQAFRARTDEEAVLHDRNGEDQCRTSGHRRRRDRTDQCHAHRATRRVSADASFQEAESKFRFREQSVPGQYRTVGMEGGQRASPRRRQRIRRRWNECTCRARAGSRARIRRRQPDPSIFWFCLRVRRRRSIRQRTIWPRI